jgi:Icc-related predicted phosphoesterase
MSRQAILVTDPSAAKPAGAIRLLCLSDTHGHHHEIAPSDLHPADILVHAGDFSYFGNPDQVTSFKLWVQTLNIPAVVIAGNADTAFDTVRLPDFAGWIRRKTHTNVPLETIKPTFLADPGNIVYLENEATVISGVKFWGSPCTPFAGDSGFRIRSHQAAAHWAAIPDDADVVVVHGPPLGVLDRTSEGKSAGCPALRAAVERARPALLVCGHIHEARGVDRIGETLCVNASIYDAEYEPTNAPFLVDLVPAGLPRGQGEAPAPMPVVRAQLRLLGVHGHRHRQSHRTHRHPGVAVRQAGGTAAEEHGEQAQPG